MNEHGKKEAEDGAFNSMGRSTTMTERPSLSIFRSVHVVRSISDAKANFVSIPLNRSIRVDIISLRPLVMRKSRGVNVLCLDFVTLRALDFVERFIRFLIEQANPSPCFELFLIQSGDQVFQSVGLASKYAFYISGLDKMKSVRVKIEAITDHQRAFSGKILENTCPLINEIRRANFFVKRFSASIGPNVINV